MKSGLAILSTRPLIRRAKVYLYEVLVGVAIRLGRVSLGRHTVPLEDAVLLLLGSGRGRVLLLGLRRTRPLGGRHLSVGGAAIAERRASRPHDAAHDDARCVAVCCVQTLLMLQMIRFDRSNQLINDSDDLIFENKCGRARCISSDPKIVRTGLRGGDRARWLRVSVNKVLSFNAAFRERRQL